MTFEEDFPNLKELNYGQLPAKLSHNSMDMTGCVSKWDVMRYCLDKQNVKAAKCTFQMHIIRDSVQESIITLKRLGELFDEFEKSIGLNTSASAEVKLPKPRKASSMRREA